MKITSLSLALFLAGTTLSAHAQTQYRVTPVGDRPLAAYSLNEKAEVAGSFGTDTSIGRPYVWRNGVVVALPWADTLPNEYSEALDINDRSELIGFSSNSITGRFEGSLWRNDQYHAIRGPAPTDSVQATAINNLDEVIALLNDEFVMWQNGHFWQLPPLHAGDSMQLERLNDLGFVVGTITPPTPPAPGQGSRAVLWAFGIPVDLGTLPGTDYSTGRALNNLAQVLGTSALRGTLATITPWIWEEGRLTALPALPGDNYTSTPNRISDRGVIVGTATFSDSGARVTALVWQNRVVYDLNDLISAADPLKPYLHLAAGIDVNNKGQILAYGHDSRDVSGGFPNVYLLTPVP